MSILIPKFIARVYKKSFHFKRQDVFEKYIDKFENHEVVVTVKKYYKGRSDNQNSLYWLWITHISNETGYEIEELHSTFKAMFLVDRSGKIPIVRSTTSLSTLEFMSYMEKIARRVAEIGIINLPNPDEWK